METLNNRANAGHSISPVMVKGLTLMPFERSFGAAKPMMDCAITPELAQQLEAMGWRVAWTKVTERYPVAQPHLRLYFYNSAIAAEVKNGNIVATYSMDPSKGLALANLNRLDMQNISVVINGYSQGPDPDGIPRFTPYISEMTFEVRPHLLRHDGGVLATVQ